MIAAHLKVHACNFRITREGRKPVIETGLRFTVDDQVVGYKDEEGKFVPPFLVDTVSSCVERMDAKFDF